MIDSFVRLPVCESAYGYHEAVWNVVRKTPDDKRKFLFRVIDAGDKVVARIRFMESISNCGVAVRYPLGGESVKFSLLFSLNPEDVRNGWIEPGSVEHWLRSRFADRGAHISHVSLSFLPWMLFGKKGHKWKFPQILAQGEIHITDPNGVKRLLDEGLGRARGFGFGLMEID